MRKTRAAPLARGRRPGGPPRAGACARSKGARQGVPRRRPAARRPPSPRVPPPERVTRVTCRAEVEVRRSSSQRRPDSPRGRLASWLKTGYGSIIRSRTTSSTRSQSGTDSRRTTETMTMRLVGRSMSSQRTSADPIRRGGRGGARHRRARQSRECVTVEAERSSSRRASGRRGRGRSRWRGCSRRSTDHSSRVEPRSTQTAASRASRAGAEARGRAARGRRTGPRARSRRRPVHVEKLRNQIAMATTVPSSHPHEGVCQWGRPARANEGLAVTARVSPSRNSRAPSRRPRAPGRGG